MGNKTKIESEKTDKQYLRDVFQKPKADQIECMEGRSDKWFELYKDNCIELEVYDIRFSTLLNKKGNISKNRSKKDYCMKKFPEMFTKYPTVLKRHIKNEYATTDPDTTAFIHELIRQLDIQPTIKSDEDDYDDPDISLHWDYMDIGHPDKYGDTDVNVLTISIGCPEHDKLLYGNALDYSDISIWVGPTLDPVDKTVVDRIFINPSIVTTDDDDDLDEDDWDDENDIEENDPIRNVVLTREGIAEYAKSINEYIRTVCHAGITVNEQVIQ